MSRQIGITGGIGSGKTTVCKIFVVLGIPVYYADVSAKQLMNSDPELKQQIIDRFGSAVYDPRLNPQALAGLVFDDTKALEDLNALVHPAVLNDYSSWYKTKKKEAPYVIKEAALLYESGSHEQLDEIIVVEADAETRIRRVMDRDGINRAAVEARMSKQDDSIAARADHLIHNDDSTPLIPQVLALHQKFLKQN